MHRLVRIALVTGVLAGCSSRPTLAGGEWTADLFGGTTNFVFGKDGSLKMDVGLPLGKMAAEGTYSETEKSVSLNLQRIELPNVDIGNAAKKLTDQIVNRPIDFKVVWKSSDEVALSPQVAAGPFGQSMTLKRRK